MAWNDEVLKLVVKNTLLVEDAYEALVYANEKLLERMGDHIDGLCRRQGSFEVEITKNGDWVLADTAWPRLKDVSQRAAFLLDGQGEEFENSTWIAILCGLAPGTSAGLYFWYPWGDRGIRKKDWKNFLKDFFSANPELMEAGFSLNSDGTAIIKPLRFDLDCLARNFDNLDGCFEPLNEALEAIFKQSRVFGKLMEKAAKL